MVVGLAYMLGIRLMPRNRDWEESDFCRPTREANYRRIDSLFAEPVDWKRLAGSLDKMLRRAVSIRAGKLLPSAILRRLDSYSRHNLWRQAFRELGRVVHMTRAQSGARFHPTGCGSPRRVGVRVDRRGTGEQEV